MADELEALVIKLRIGNYNGIDITEAWIAIEELIKLREWMKKSF